MPNNPPWTWNPTGRRNHQPGVSGVQAGCRCRGRLRDERAHCDPVGHRRVESSGQRGKKAGDDWLRDSLGFKGILTSDDLWYDHVIARFGPEEVALKAFEAGHDIILKPKDPVKVIAALTAAVRSGRISERRIDAAVRKLLTLKARLGLPENRMVDEAKVNALVGTPEHLALVQEVADRSLTLLRNDGVFPVAAGRLARMVNINIQKLDGDPAPQALSTKLAAAFPGIQSFYLRPDLDPGYYQTVWQAANAADLVVLSLFVQRNRLGDATPVRDSDLAFIQKVIAAKPKAVIAMSYGNPHLIRKIPGAAAFVVGYGEKGWFGNQTVYFDSFIKLLKGELKPSGKLPVKVSDDYPIGVGVTF